MNEKKSFVIQLIAGAALAAAGALTHFEYYSTLLFATGIGLAFSSVSHLFRILYWQSPKHREAFINKKLEEHINNIDERKQFIRIKAGSVTYQIMTFFLLGLEVVLVLFRVDTLVIAILFALFILNWLVGIVVYRVLEKRM